MFAHQFATGGYCCLAGSLTALQVDGTSTTMTAVLVVLGVLVIGLLVFQRLRRNRSHDPGNAVPISSTNESTDQNNQADESYLEVSQRLAERNRQLLEQASKLEAVLSSIADGVIVLDSNNQIVTSNPAANRILADMSSDFSYAPLRELPDFLFGGQATEDAGSASNPLLAQQTRRFRVGGRVLSASAAPVRTPDGESLGTVVVLRDITREAEAENLKDSFIASISHELRTPLTAIKGYSDLLIRLYDRDSDDHALRFAKAISHNTNQLMQHINGLIDMSQIQAGELSLVKERISFNDVVVEVVERWRTRVEAKGLTLTVQPHPEPLWIYGDRDRLYWATYNLLSNAYNYTLPTGRVEVRVFREANEARADVVDTGVGIASNDLPYLFSRFFRARNELTFSVPGVGLGLFITRSIVEQHDGRVWARSDLGIGSTFSLALPLFNETENSQPNY